MQRPTKILIIKPSSLGDIIHGLQIAASIKEQLQNVTIDWVVRNCFSRIVETSGIADKIYLFYRRGGLRKFIKLISEIRQSKYDYVLDMHGLARSGVMTYFARADKKIGRSDAREFSWLAYDKKIKFPSVQTPHAIVILLQFLPELGILAKLPSSLQFSPNPSSEVFEDVKEFVASAAGNLPVLIFPESRRAEKEWPHFTSLVKELAKEFPQFPLIIVGQNHQNFPQGKNICNLTGCTTIDDVIFLVQNASLVVANDSAPMHLAAAVGTPVVALFGPTNPAKFGPYPKSSTTSVLKPADYSIASIPVHEVLVAISELLQNRNKAA